jgi:hypothetical protein
MQRIAISRGIRCFGDAFWADHHRVRGSKQLIHIVSRIGGLAKN